MAKIQDKLDAEGKRIDGQVVAAGKVFGMDPNTAWIVFGVIVVLALVGLWKVL